jgi:hypothetical protein
MTLSLTLPSHSLCRSIASFRVTRDLGNLSAFQMVLAGELPGAFFPCPLQLLFVAQWSLS